MGICDHDDLLDLDVAMARLAAAIPLRGLPAVVAERDDPALDRSAMDGLAVRAADGQSVRKVLGTLYAGMDPSTFLVGPGEGVRIMTGACLPEGADAVVPVEVLAEGGSKPIEAPKAGDHVRRKGSQALSGATILPEGKAWQAARIGLLAQEGLLRPLPPRPRVAIASTGDELVVSPSPWQIRDSNGPMLEALAFRLGAETRRMARLPDREGALRDALLQLTDTDVLLTSGGVSAGDKDLLPGVLRELGADLLFHKIRLKPGKPMLAARLQHRIILGLPGNPQSAYLNALLFLPLVLARWQGMEAPSPWRQNRLLSPVKNKGERPLLAPCTIEPEGLRPLSHQGSGDLGALARADACARIAPGGQGVGPVDYLSLL